jgi:hypothetical protein
VVFTWTAPKSRLAGVRSTAPAVPTPPRLTLYVLVVAGVVVGMDSVMVRLPVRVPAAVGANATETVQLAPGARVLAPAGQLEGATILKSPVTTIDVSVAGAEPLLATVTT